MPVPHIHYSSSSPIPSDLLSSSSTSGVTVLFKGLVFLTYNEQFHSKATKNLRISWDHLDLEFWMVTFSGLALSYLLQPVLQLERLPQCHYVLPVTTEWNSLFPVQSLFQVYHYVLLVPTHLLGCGLSLGLRNNQYC